jgi:hypothetical protein
LLRVSFRPFFYYRNIFFRLFFYNRNIFFRPSSQSRPNFEASLRPRDHAPTSAAFSASHPPNNKDQRTTLKPRPAFDTRPTLKPRPTPDTRPVLKARPSLDTRPTLETRPQPVPSSSVPKSSQIQPSSKEPQPLSAEDRPSSPHSASSTHSGPSQPLSPARGPTRRPVSPSTTCTTVPENSRLDLFFVRFL